MLVLSILSLIIASLAAFLSLNTEEEIVKVASGCTAVLLILLTLLVAPWLLKLVLVAVPLLWDRLNNRSTQKLTH
ncbi:hypothetical protein [Gloeothece verrucosa]|uniref:Uncharacterized protein n=1 Tax=Gloeothece verrucosa (strain PCC 7822) TaxID=497965 RepID=E0UH41_GLOV7|nr:hypothetical protein [Gloeothece verrucosa]ADN15640.1 conserved hypothetical protein [Gloeothece verrucosa PCC 7822]